mmetsp:Transcript_56984/g.144622  ORF Transcript_56984/g.144622 Transcript_56984/m.144622 type:complete len:206 (-) Transcript_56984:2336-2953(-)
MPMRAFCTACWNSSRNRSMELLEPSSPPSAPSPPPLKYPVPPKPVPIPPAAVANDGATRPSFALRCLSCCAASSLPRCSWQRSRSLNVALLASAISRWRFSTRSTCQRCKPSYRNKRSRNTATSRVARSSFSSSRRKSLSRASPCSAIRLFSVTRASRSKDNRNFSCSHSRWRLRTSCCASFSSISRFSASCAAAWRATRTSWTA